MISDKETNIVYFSELIKTIAEHETIISALDKNQIRYRYLKATKDIWCRDFMPIQISESNFVQFRYQPSYLDNDKHLQSDTKTVLRVNKIIAEFSDINLDGGNVIKLNDKIIITKRVFKENPNLDQRLLKIELQKLLKAEVFFIPDITQDMTGHADGHLRFIDKNTIMVNELKNEFPYWKTGFLKMIKEANLDYIEIPWFEHKDKSHPLTAIGCYVNYLEIGNLILFPVFGLPGNKDNEAFKVMKQAFPNRVIEKININGIANLGGLLNCITWTIKE